MNTARDLASVPPALLAGFAESAVWFIPLNVLAVDTIGLTTGPLLGYPLFVLLFTGAVAAATWLHRSPLLPSAIAASALVVGALQVLFSTGGGVLTVAGSVALMLVLAVRVLTMALRDWRNPVGEAFALGAAVLLAEVVVTAGSDLVDRGLAPLLIAQFFLGSMASRAASMRLATPVGHAHGAARRLRAAGVAVLVLAAALGAGTLLGGGTGVLGRLGELVLAAVLPVVEILALIVARLLIGPLNWLFGQLNLDFQPLRDFAAFLADSRLETPRNEGGGGWILRVVGLAVLAAMAWLLVRILRALWAPEEEEAPFDVGAEPPAAGAAAQARRRRARRLRRELPPDTVRRWYAEALILLEGKGLVKEPSRTPSEFAAEVRRAFPASGAEFGALTRGYEQVRYGNLTLGEEAIDRLDAHRTLLAERLRGAPRPGGGGGDG